MSKVNLATGRLGEEEAVLFLKRNGYKIICRNYRNSLGEIDIIAKDREVICFVEVKTRGSADFGYPAESVGRSKQNQIAKASIVYLKEKNLLDSKARFDVASVLHKEGGPEIEIIKNAFILDERFSL